MKKNVILKTLAALSVSAMIMAFGTGCGSQVEYAPSTDTVAIEKQDLENYISVQGKVEGTNIVKVTSEVSARVKELNVEIGSQVKEGDVLCVFDDSDLRSQYNTLKESSEKTDEKLQALHDINQRSLNTAKTDKENALAQAQRAIDRAVSARDSAYKKYDETLDKINDYYAKYIDYYNAAGEGDMAASEKANEYYQMYKSAQAEYDAMGDQLTSYDTAIQDAKDAYAAAERNADAAIQAANDAINNEKFDTDTSIQEQLDKLQDKIDKCTVKADRSGIVTALNISEGSIPTSEAIMTIEDDSQLRINVSIDEADILNVKEGLKAVITTTATGENEFTGKVSRIVNIMSGQVTNSLTGETTGGGYSAEITVDDQDQLLIGMSAKVKIILDEKSDVYAVPYNAIIENDDGTFSVIVASGTGDNRTAKFVNIEKGMETNFLTEITSTEISDGDLIVTDPEFITEGMSLNVAGSYYDSVQE